MKNEYKNIFNNTEPLTKKEIQDYLSGNLSPEEKYRIELKIENNELNRTAMQGYSENPGAINNLPHFSGKTGISSLSRILIFSSVFIVVAITTYFLLNDENNEKIAISTSNNELSLADQKLLDEQISVEMELENSEEIEPSEQITYRKAVENQVAENKIPEKIEKFETIAPEKIANQKDSINLEIEIKNRINSGIVYIHDLKTVDYSNIYTSGIKIFTHNLDGVPAQFGSEEEKNNASIEDFKLEFIPYSDYLGSALLKFVNSNYRGTLKDLKIILSQYPGDINADFYSGLCYFNLGKWKKAIQCFSQAKTHKFNAFQQEASWYLALSLVKNNEMQEAIELFQEIEKNKGFYSERAGDVLKKLN
ncbi:MAG: CDC27 family protein [Bacteroidales bacterium]|nr:CDC27 family protein [Bacteroidales bacterium]